jgi:hypothetical protein
MFFTPVTNGWEGVPKVRNILFAGESSVKFETSVLLVTRLSRTDCGMLP